MTNNKIIDKSFQEVKDFVVKRFPEFSDTEIRLCSIADEKYEESEETDDEPAIYAHVFHYDNDIICVTEKMEELSEEQRQGIFIHEFAHLYADNHPEMGYDSEEDADADLIVTDVFNVNLDYDDNLIEIVKVPIGSEAPPDLELTKEELDTAIQEEFGDNYEYAWGNDEEEEEEEEGEEEYEGEEEEDYGLELPDSDDLKDSLTLVPEQISEEEAKEMESEGPIIDME